MSPPDSEGKCQCQHCDGKQSARECLCDSVGVTSTIHKPEFQLGEKKVRKLLRNPTSLSAVDAATRHAAGWWWFSINNFDFKGKTTTSKQAGQWFAKRIVRLVFLTDQIVKWLIWLLCYKRKWSITFVCVPDLSLDLLLTTSDFK